MRRERLRATCVRCRAIANQARESDPEPCKLAEFVENRRRAEGGGVSPCSRKHFWPVLRVCWLLCCPAFRQSSLYTHKLRSSAPTKCKPPSNIADNYSTWCWPINNLSCGDVFELFPCPRAREIFYHNHARLGRGIIYTFISIIPINILLRTFPIRITIPRRTLWQLEKNLPSTGTTDFFNNSKF